MMKIVIRPILCNISLLQFFVRLTVVVVERRESIIISFPYGYIAYRIHQDVYSIANLLMFLTAGATKDLYRLC